MYKNGNTTISFSLNTLNKVMDYFIDNLSFSDKDRLMRGEFTIDSHKQVWMDYFTKEYENSSVIHRTARVLVRKFTNVLS